MDLRLWTWPHSGRFEIQEIKIKTSPKEAYVLDHVTHRVWSAYQSHTKVRTNFACVAPRSEKKLISKVLFLKWIQHLKSFGRRKWEYVWKTASALIQERLIKQGEKCLASLLSEASRQLGKTKSFMSNRMKNRAMGPASVIRSFFLALYVSVRPFVCFSLHHHFTRVL